MGENMRTGLKCYKCGSHVFATTSMSQCDSDAIDYYVKFVCGGCGIVLESEDLVLPVDMKKLYEVLLENVQ